MRTGLRSRARPLLCVRLHPTVVVVVGSAFATLRFRAQHLFGRARTAGGLPCAHRMLFRPTADGMAAEKDSEAYWRRMQVRSLAPRYPGKWEYLSLKPKDVCDSLKAFVQAGGRADGAQ